MSLKSSLKRRPVIYEIVPPRRDTSRFNTELQGIEQVLEDRRIAAINIPELMARREAKGKVHYSPTTMPPEEYAVMIRDYKEPIVNVVAPRLAKSEFLARARRILRDLKMKNIVVVGKERQGDVLPGPGVVEALGLVRSEDEGAALGGICIFDRETGPSSDYGARSRLSEARRVWLKAKSGCDFVTSQIAFDPRPALGFIAAYRRLCEETETEPLTVFVSLTTVPTKSILSLIESLDVVVPLKVKRRMEDSGNMGAESLKVGAEVFQDILSESERRGDGIPLGLQIEQVGVNSAGLSLELLDRVYAGFR